MPKMRVSVSPPRIAPPRSAQLLGGGASSCRLPAQWCSGASVRVPSPVPEGVRAEPRWRSGGSLGPPKRGSCPVPLSENAHAWIARAPRASHPVLRSGAHDGGVPGHASAGRATVPTYAAPVATCQFSPRRPVRSPSPLRTPRAASPLLVRPITYHVGGRCAGAACASRAQQRDSRTPSPCAQKVFRSGQPLRVAVLPSNQAGDPWMQRLEPQELEYMKHHGSLFPIFLPFSWVSLFAFSRGLSTGFAKRCLAIRVAEAAKHQAS